VLFVVLIKTGRKSFRLKLQNVVIFIDAGSECVMICFCIKLLSLQPYRRFIVYPENGAMLS